MWKRGKKKKMEEMNDGKKENVKIGGERKKKNAYKERKERVETR